MRKELSIREYFEFFAPDRVYDARTPLPLKIPDSVLLVMEEGKDGTKVFGLCSSQGETIWINKVGEKIQSMSLFRDIEGRVFLVCRVIGRNCCDRFFLIKNDGETLNLSFLWKGLPETKRVACYLEFFKYLRAEVDGFPLLVFHNGEEFRVKARLDGSYCFEVNELATVCEECA